ncbi:MAG: putative RND superfamily exporter protein [Saprospiraceae bacterium]|jgi:predicted RND superfamily exporter protein
MFLDYRKYIIAAFIFLIPISAYQVYHLKFAFDFEQFFPEGDPDLDFFQDFIKEFKTDDNFLLVAIDNEPTVFDEAFLKKFHQFTLELRDIPYVTSVQSLTTMDYPIKTPFGINTIPIIHIDQPDRYEFDKKNILSDKRFVNNYIASDGQSLAITARTIEAIGLEESKEMMTAIKALRDRYNFQETHLLGRAYFQDELVEMQKDEITVSTAISGILIIFILMLIFRKPIGVFIALTSISLGLLYFMGIIGLLGRELNIMSALYPVLMLIVGTSDVIHIMSKYVDELRQGKDKRSAMIVTIKEIGLATLFTSVTTAIGFATLMTSNVRPIKEFGANAALGVMVAYFTVVLFTTCVLTLFSKNQIMKETTENDFWNRLMKSWYGKTLTHGKLIVGISVVFVAVCFYGMSKITMNYNVEDNLPINAQLTDDFLYFEKKYSGFRPVEFAITVKDDELTADGYRVLAEVSKIEDKLYENPNIKSILGMTTIYKSIERMNGGNRADAFKFPENERAFKKSKRLVERMAGNETSVMISKDKKKTRISTRIADIGAENIKAEGEEIDRWINENIDTSIISVKRTGTGLLIDKNAEYIRDNLLQGLLIALILVSLLMALLFRDWKMLLVALVPNFVPVIFAAGLLGFLSIELEAGVSIIFAVVFGIAVDDTIHFLSKYKLARDAKKTVEESIKITFEETGKAITFTTIILFFGFLVMLFSNHPPSVTVGLLISVTLVAALICDLFLLPVLMRNVLKD